MGEVGERGHQAGPLLGSERGGELLEALEAGLEGPARDGAAAGGGTDALHPAVLVVLAALEVAAAQERVDRPAAAGQGEAELLGDLLDGELAAAVGQDAEGLDVRHREVELVEDREHRLALALHEVVPEGQELGGELLGSCLRMRICCLHERKYCTRAAIPYAEIISGAHAFGSNRARARLRLQQVVLRGAPAPADAERRGRDAAVADLHEVAAGAQVGAQLGRVARVDRRGLLADAGAAAGGGLEGDLLGGVGQVRDDEADRPRAEAPRRHRNAVGRYRAGDDDPRRWARHVAPLARRATRGERERSGDRRRRGPARGCSHRRRASVRRPARAARAAYWPVGSPGSPAISRRRRWRRSHEAPSASSYSLPSRSRRSSW